MSSPGRPIPLWKRRPAEVASVSGCVLLVVAVTLAAWLSYRSHRDGEQEFALRHADDMALVLQAHTRDTLLSVDDAVVRIKRYMERDGRIDLPQLMGQEFRDIRNYITVASVADAQGRLVYSTLPIPPGAAIADLEHFRAHLAADTGKPFINKPILGRVSGKWSFHLTRRINKPDGAFGGVAIIAVDLSYWEHLLRQGTFGEAGLIALVGRDGSARAVFGRNGAAAPALMKADWTFLSAASAGNGAPGRLAAPPGLGAQSATWAHRNLGEFPLLVAVSVDEDIVAGRLASMRNWHIGGATALILLACAFTAGLLAFLARQRRFVAEHARIAGALQLSEERYRSLFESNPLPLYIRAEDSLDILAVNQAAVDKYGYSHEEFSAITTLQLHSPATREAYLQSLAQRPPGAAEINRRVHVTRDGRELDVEVTSRPFVFNGRAARLCVASDVTVQVRSERIVRESEERLRTIANQLGEGLALYDQDDRLIFFNEPYRRLASDFTNDLELGMPIETVIRKRAERLREAGEITDVEAYVQERMTSHRSGSTGLIERKRADGGYHLVREARTADGQTILIVVDITELKQRETELRRSEQRFRAMFDYAGIGITMRPVHDRSHPWEVVNDRFSEMTGYSREELLRMSTADITSPDDHHSAIEENRRLRMGEIASYTREKRILRKDGSPLWVQLSVAVLPDVDGKPDRLIATYQDINARKLAEERLRESEGLFRAIFNQAGIGISTRPAGAPGAPWLTVNDKLCEMTGYSREEMLHITSREITPPDGHAAADRDSQRLLSGQISSYTREKQVVCKDGTLLWVNISVALVRDVAGRPHRIVATYQDIHARVQAEERLRQSEEHLRAIIAAEPECVATVDAKGTLLSMNPAGLAMLDALSVAEVRRRPLIDYVAPEHRRAFARLHRRVLTGHSGMLEFQVIGQHGTPRWLEIHAAPLHDAGGAISALLGVARDVTERRNAREALAAERILLRSIIDNIPDYIHVKDRNLNFVLGNAAWLNYRKRREVKGMNSFDVVDRETAALYQAEDRELLRTSQPTLPRETIENDVPDGPRWTVTTKWPLRDPAGNVIGIIGVGRDVTDFKRRSLEVEKLNAGLEARVAERTAQLSTANDELEAFASSVSHDLRAPLRNVDGLAAGLLEDYADRLDAPGREVLQGIRAAASRMGSLIEDLLRLSRVARVEMQLAAIDLGRLAREIVSDLRRENPERSIDIRIAEHLPVTGDAGMLRTALTNLIQNAWKFTGKTAGARIEVGRLEQGGRTVYFVRDNGAGFDMSYAGRLFGAFQRLHNVREFPGTGVGLATVRRVMRRHGGDVWAEAAVGQGATFYFTLGGGPALAVVPAVRAATVVALPPLPAGTPARGATVLFVDDDPDSLLLTARALRGDGYAVLTAIDGEAALAQLRDRRVDIVVSDFSMPGMNGAQLLAQVRQRFPATLRVILSGQATNAAMQEGLQRGEIHRCFEKSFGYDPLRDYLKAWLDTPGQQQEVI